MMYRLESFIYTSVMEILMTNLIERKVQKSNEKEVKG
jgi:hypothetical protein